jgi:RHS repeat-associated protein
VYDRPLSDLSGSYQGAGGIGGLLARTDAGGSAFYHADAGGNITSLTDVNGAVVARYLYDPFGTVIGKWGALADANVMRFSSMPRHANSGLSLYLFRAYDPSLQRWTQPDPMREKGGPNLYSCFDNNAINFADPLGLYVALTMEDGTEKEIPNTGSALVKALQEAANKGESIEDIVISGHGTPDLITLDADQKELLLAANGQITVSTGDSSTDITDLLRKVLTPHGSVHLNGCGTANGTNSLTKNVSKALPGRKVYGISSPWAIGTAGGFLLLGSPGLWFEGLMGGGVIGWHERYIDGKKSWPWLEQKNIF